METGGGWVWVGPNGGAAKLELLHYRKLWVKRKSD